MARKIVLTVGAKKKLKPRGNPDKIKQFQFKKGQSGNPSGRPKGSGSKQISDAYKVILNQQVPQDVLEKLGIEVENCTWSDLIAIQQVRKAVELPGARVNQTAVQELREVTEGKLPESHEISGKGGTPLQAPTFAIPVEFVDPKKENNNAERQGEEDS